MVVMKRHSGRATRGGLAGLALAGAWIWLGTLASAAGTTDSAAVRVPPELPVADFARAPQYSNMQLSPDGKAIGYLTQDDGGSGFGFLSLDDMKPVGIFFENKGEYAFNAVYGFQWSGSKRVLVDTALGWGVVDRDLKRFKYLTGSGRALEEGKTSVGFQSDTTFYPDGIVGDDRQEATDLHMLNRSDVSGMDYRPDVYRVNIGNGSFNLLEKNPGNVEGWGADWDGNIRFGLISDGVQTDLIYRDAPGHPWSLPLDFGRAGAGCSIAGLDADDHTLYVFKPSPQGRLALYSFDLQTRRFSEPLFQHEKYDVTGAIFSAKYRRLLGVRYLTDGPRQYWFQPELAQLQKTLNAASPGLVNEFVSMDREMQRILVYSHSARQAGYYTLFDLATGRPQPIAQTRPWLKAGDMAEMYPVKCQARDGLELNGYLSLPPGRGRKNLPMVTLVHGGPYGIRDGWGFDPLVQFLANRGYAVLQVNYRGSGGYGVEFFDKGRHEVGKGIQDDIEDLTRWAVAQGIADPHRLAIMGGSYGGYSALYALAKTPALFRCGVACAAVSDWNGLLQYLRDEHQYSRNALRYWAAMLGDMAKPGERERLAAVSPVNLAAQIKAPLFLMHGEEDTTVPIEQAHAMAAALKKAGHPPETLYLQYVGHQWPTDKKGVEFLRRVESFLAANLGQ